MDFGKDYKFYDPNYIDHPNHNHLICMDCSKIVEFEDVHIDTLETCISKRLGFTPAQDRPLGDELHAMASARGGN
jgi:Fur family ferric uptake transcriptional regulator